MIKTQFQAQIQVLRIDNGQEYFHSILGGYLEQNGMIHQSSCVNTPQQNGRLLLKFFQEFSPFVRLVVGNGERIRFWEDLWWGNQTLCSQFADLYRVISVKNLTVSNVLGNSSPLSWNFNFRRNLTDSEIDLLQILMSSLSFVLFSPSSSDSRAWSLSSLGLFSVKSFFLALSKVSNPILFLPTKFLWSSKAPSKVKALTWLVAHGKVNTNDKLLLRRPYKSL